MAKSQAFKIALLLAFAFLSTVNARPRSRSIHSSKRTVQVEGDAEFKTWLPKWWAPEERDWKTLTSPTVDVLEYYGQDQEDKHAMDHYFHGKEGLFYLEMGALNGVRYSNTLAFQKSKKSRGLLIEANPVSYNELVVNRPNDICVNVAVCDTFQNVHFADNPNPAVAGIVEFMPESFQKQWHAANSISSAVVVPCLPLGAIVKKLNVRHIDLWSLDVEGAELKVLQTVDWKYFSADVILIEADGHDAAKDQAVIDLLVDQGYVFDGLVDRNNWFHHESFAPSKAPSVGSS